jgi:GNAT superfamily N-acetyltransferase
MTNIKIYETKDQTKEFYSKMGKYFAFREYAKEMGGWQFYNKENSVWFLMEDSFEETIGFCALFFEKSHIFLDNFFINKKFRGKGYSRLLFDKRLDYAKFFDLPIQAIVENPIQEHNYKRCNFEIYGMRGHYRKWRLLPNENNK